MFCDEDSPILSRYDEILSSQYVVSLGKKYVVMVYPSTTFPYIVQLVSFRGAVGEVW